MAGASEAPCIPGIIFMNPLVTYIHALNTIAWLRNIVTLGTEKLRSGHFEVAKIAKPCPSHISLILTQVAARAP